MVSITERIKTNWLLIDDLDMWDEFTIKKSDDKHTRDYYSELEDIIYKQLRASIDWLETPEAKRFFYNEAKYSQEVFESLDNEWDKIINGKYSTIDELLDEFYNTGKRKGYSDIRSRIRFTEADHLALTFAKNYNFELINRLSDDLNSAVKNQIFKSIIAGENPNKLANELLKLGVKPLPSMTLSAKQRATMIAKTEVSRIQNTGILQSYVNEGYIEVTILTAEDNHVCYLCLQNAYEFNEKDEVIFENRGVDKVHNIAKLSPNNYVPLHPNCRCTYLAVWETKGKPPEDPYTVELSPYRNWSYNYDGKRYSIRGNTPQGRKQFADQYGVDFGYMDKDYEEFVRIYSDEGATIINDYLRKINDDLDYAKSEWKKVAEGLGCSLSFSDALKIKDEIFRKYARTLEEDIIICRREINRHMGANNKPTYNDDGLTSMTIYEHTKKEDYGDELSLVLIPVGTPILYIEKITETKEDFEVLMPTYIEVKLVEDLDAHTKLWRLA